MFVSFQELPDTARIWIYQSTKTFDAQALASVKDDIQQFLIQWTAHGQGLKTGFTIPFNRFIVLGVDQQHAQASGCSIDSSVRFIREIERKYQTTLLDNSLIAYNQNGQIQMEPIPAFKKLIASGQVDANTIVYNNLLTYKYDFLSRWMTPAKDAWHRKFFKENTV
ncbi:MAG: ABC transporter ATPase [Bacteroidetes bacterium]|nr:ABC transporter ATPase [Bacteroidota bacterium]